MLFANQLSVITITFYSPAGDLPLLLVSASLLTHASGAVTTDVVQVTAGSKEDSECNNRGRCGTQLSRENGR